MYIFTTAIKIILSKYPRYLLFLGAAAVLSVCFAALSQGVLYNERITDPITVIIVDNDDSMESRLFTQMFIDYELYADILNFTLADSESEARALIEQDYAAAALILPPDFAQNIRIGENEPFLLILNEAQFLKKTLIEYFAAAFSDMLAAGQSGVYAALDYTANNNPEQWQRMFQLANLKFINMVLNRADWYRMREVSAVDALSTYTHFALGFWVFVNLTAIVLFVDVLRENYGAATLKKLFVYKARTLIITAQLILAFFCALVVLNAPVLTFIRFDAAYSPAFFAALSLSLLCVAALVVLAAYLFTNAHAANLAVCALALLGFFLSGGIIPRVFFAAPLRGLSYFTFNYWLFSVLEKTAAGQAGQGQAFLAVAAISLAVFAAAAAAVRRAGTRAAI